MPRPRRCRRIWFQPDVTFFKPAGMRMINLEESILSFDEFEAVRLKDFLGLEQEKAAKKMNISQPTFHRLVLAARKKIADAIVNGKAIKIEGGNFKMVQQRKRMRRRMRWRGPATSCACPKCGYEEAKVRGTPCASKKCPKCGSLMVRGS